MDTLIKKKHREGHLASDVNCIPPNLGPGSEFSLVAVSHLFFNIYYLDHLEHLHYDDGEVYDDDHDDLEHLHYDDEKVISLILV